MSGTTTRLAAVNQMLRAISEAPVTDLSEVEGMGLDIETATGTLDEVQRAVLLEGWIFNTEHEVALLPDPSGYIYLPHNTLRLEVSPQDDTDPVIRGGRIYDRANRTYEFSGPIKSDLIVFLDFDDMPESARSYVAYRAARKFQSTQLGSNTLHRFNQRDENWMRSVFVQEQSEDRDNNMLFDTPDFHRLRRNRYAPH
jgi:hypothetical protein